MGKFYITESEVKEIKKLYGILNEQTAKESKYILDYATLGISKSNPIFFVYVGENFYPYTSYERPVTDNTRLERIPDIQYVPNYDDVGLVAKMLPENLKNATQISDIFELNSEAKIAHDLYLFANPGVKHPFGLIVVKNGIPSVMFFDVINIIDEVNLSDYDILEYTVGAEMTMGDNISLSVGGKRNPKKIWRVFASVSEANKSMREHK